MDHFQQRFVKKRMRVPAKFELTNILKQNVLPAPRKSRMRKSDLYLENSRFKLIDQHAEQIARSNYSTFRHLIWHLIYGNDVVKNDLDKVRTIFQWMLSRDWKQPLFTETSEENTVEKLLEYFGNGKSTHAQVFQILCLYSGLYCKVIVGVAKGRHYIPGETCSQEKFQHCWNAVRIDDNWFLLDLKWASRRSLQDTSVSEFYFLTDPDQLLLSHWAEDLRWQLVDRPITMSEFENLPFVKPQFFLCGLSFISNVKGVLETKRGQVKWEIGLSNQVKFSYKLVSMENGTENQSDLNLKDFIFHEIQNGRAAFILRSPNPGSYCLKLFAKRIDDRIWDKSKFVEVLEYKVHIDNTCIEDDPLPNCWDRTWGPGPRSERLCVYPVQKRGLITTNEKSVTFEINKTRPVKIQCRFCRNGWKESELQKCIKLQDNETKTYVVVSPPYPGEYGLEIYGTVPTKEDNIYTHVCQYFISSQRRDEDVTDAITFSHMNGHVSSMLDTNSKMLGLSADAPDTFVLSPLPDDQNVPEVIPWTPKSVPDKPKCESFKFLDDHAKKICDEQCQSVRDLLWKLVYSQKVDDDISKARLLFTWLASKRVQDITFSEIEAGSPEETLKGLNTGRTTYAMALQTLCRFCGLLCKVITGIAKGMDYKPGQQLAPGSSHHTWNIIHLKGNWCFVDTRFARRQIISSLTASGEFQYEFDDHFFMTDPNKFIYTHFPDDEHLQMLTTPVTLEEFCNMPIMTPHFFMLGLGLFDHKEHKLYSKGETTITLLYPSDRKHYHFTFSIHPSHEEEEFQGVKFNRFGMLEANKGKVTFTLRLPRKDTYVFYVYAKEELPDKKDSMFTQVCEFKIEQQEVLDPLPRPFPPCPYQSWGPGSSFYQYNLETNQCGSIIIAKGGSAKFEIKAPKAMQYRTRMVQHNTNSEFEGYVTYKTVDDKTVFSVTVPEKGEYGLEIYAKDPDTDTKKMRHIAQYLVRCDEDVETLKLPKLPSGFLGPQPMLVKYGVTALSHPDPVIHLETNTVEIQFKTSQGMRFTTNMTMLDGQRDCSEYVFIQSEDLGVRIVITLPKIGFYALCVHGNPFEDNSQQIPGLYNYLINCNKMEVDAVPYPKQYGFWKEGCYMLEPMAICPALDNFQVPFQVKVPKATTVAVVVNKDWSPLILNDFGIWEGKIDIDTSQNSTKIVLVACYGEDDRFSTLLEYNI
ncbi:hypothetical protein KUTeg_005607 [Tegillarca granosa]|uniref:Transglutaminase-like domain-containing protein n=1 Tax=Tegillarca granosa TaxID=220873 RepID=A0ABQ9FK82_TEGGR|nr:hypothetical protein KUTeg_005607 [Tegillarca granosa]